MTNWGRGGIFWSLNRWVEREVRDQLRSNPLARRARYRFSHRVMRLLFSPSSFWKFLGLYFLLDITALGIEGLWQHFAPESFPKWVGSPSVIDIIKTVPSYLIGAQVGILSVISLALALVTLIAQRDDAAADVQVYYHESLFFEITASCLALTAVLAVQLLWPLQFGLHLLGYGGNGSFFKAGLLFIHLLWFFVNMAAVAHFISVTFRFPQRRERERLRESYTANVMVPREWRQRIREAVYSSAGSEAINSDDDGINVALFGVPMTEPYIIELCSTFRRPVRIKNVLIRPAFWAIQRWWRRCGFEPSVGAAPLSGRPRLWIQPSIGQTLRGKVDWCRREGGVPLDRIERAVLRLAFRFERVRDAE